MSAPNPLPEIAIEQPDRKAMARALGTRAAVILDGATSEPKPFTLNKVRYTHDAMIDAIIADPSIHQNTLGKMFGFTPGWVSVAVNSDAFKTRLAQRKAEIVDPVLMASTEERFRALTHKSVEVLLKKLSDPNPSDALALKAAEIGAKALGTGGNAAPAPSSDHLTILARRLTALQRGDQGVIEDANFSIIEGTGAQDGGSARTETPDASLCDQATEAARHGQGGSDRQPGAQVG